jgi:hypothetical protein
VDSPIAVYMDSLYDLWGSDTVHGDKLAYSKIAIGLLDSLNRTLPDSDLRHNLQSRKRSLDSSPDLLSRREDSFHRRYSERQGGNNGDSGRSDREPHRHLSSQSNRDSYSYQSNRDFSGFQSNRDYPAFSTYPGTSRDRFGGRGGGRRLDY